MRVRAWATLLAAGCFGGPAVEPPLACDPACRPGDDGAASTCATEPTRWLTVDSPSDGVVLRGTFAPLVVPVTEGEQGARVAVCLDGEPVDAGGALVRKRSRNVGGGYDLIGMLDLLEVVPGLHELVVVLERADGQQVRGLATVEVRPRTHRVDLSVVDEAGAPASARVVVTDAAGRLVDLGPEDGPAADPYARDVPLHSVFVVDGKGAVRLEPGRYRLLAARGVRDDLATVELDLDADRAVDLVIRRAVPDAALAADLHVHTARSYDAFVPDPLRMASLLAAGLDAAVITDHNLVVDADASLLALTGPGRGGLRLVPGVEADVDRPGPRDGGTWDLGHINVFPTLGEATEPLPPKAPASVAAYLDAYRARQARAPFPGAGGGVVLQLNHPRGIHFDPAEPPQHGAWPLFRALGFDPRQPLDAPANAAWLTPTDQGTDSLSFDTIEVMNRFSAELYAEVRADWFALLQQGRVITATGNADSHALQVEVAGFPVNLVDAPRPVEGQPLDHAAFVEALQDGRVVVTTGPVPALEVTGDRGATAKPGGQVKARGGATVGVRVRAAPWIPVAEVRLVVNGEVVRTEHPAAPAPGQALDVAWTWPLDLEADGWVLVEAGHPLWEGGPQPVQGGDYGLVAPGYVPMALTNPVLVDADGDGVWVAPGLFP